MTHPFARLEKSLVGIGFALEEIYNLPLPEVYLFFALEWDKQLKEQAELKKMGNGGF